MPTGKEARKWKKKNLLSLSRRAPSIFARSNIIITCARMMCLLQHTGTGSFTIISGSRKGKLTLVYRSVIREHNRLLDCRSNAHTHARTRARWSLLYTHAHSDEDEEIASSNSLLLLPPCGYKKVAKKNHGVVVVVAQGIKFEKWGTFAGGTKRDRN